MRGRIKLAFVKENEVDIWKIVGSGRIKKFNFLTIEDCEVFALPQQKKKRNNRDYTHQSFSRELYGLSWEGQKLTNLNSHKLFAVV